MFDRFKNTESILTWLIWLAYFGLFFPIQISNILLIALLGFCLLKTDYRVFLKNVRESTFAQIMAGIFLIQVIGLLYTSNMEIGFFMLEKKISFLLIPPLLLPLLQRFGANINSTLRGMGYITIFSSLLLLVIATLKKFAFHDPRAFFYEDFTSIHYVYYALYFGCGSLILIDSLFEDLIKRKYGIFFVILLFLYSLGVLIFVASKTGIIGFSLASFIFLYKKISNKKAFIVAAVLFLLSLTVFFYLNPTSRERFQGLGDNLAFLQYDDLSDKEVYFDDLNMRLLFWKVSLSHLWDDKLFFVGVGTGDAQDYIDTLYRMPQHYISGYIGWDSHNQWIFTLIQVGLPGLFLMAVLYAKYFRAAWARSDLKLLSFLVISLFFTMSESILESNKGIVFFALMFTVLASAYFKKQDPTHSTEKHLG